MDRPRLLVALLALATLSGAFAACSEIVGPDTDFEPANLIYGSEGPVYSLPDTIPRGLPFAVVINSYGNGCVTRGDMRVDLEGRRIVFEPLDINSGAPDCTDVLRIFEHRATLAVNESRTYEVRIEGWAQPADTAVVLVDTLVVR